MKVIENLAQLQGEYKDVVLTLGNFDGIHLGHQAILRRVLERSERLKSLSVVFTFREHPLKVLADGKQPPMLTTLQEKLSLLESLGIDAVICIPFTREIASESAEQFIHAIYSLLRPRRIIVGHDYAFGKGRSGNSALLEYWGKRYGYQVEVVEAFEVGGITVSSTVIRQKITRGYMREAAKLLGRPYSLEADVVSGQQKGKQLDFRTANLGAQPKMLPGCGVYAVTVRLEGKSYQGVANVGYQPTYGQNDLQVEVHVLDFAGDLYGCKLGVSFIARLREERKFPDKASLNEQIAQDVCSARRILTKINCPE